MIRFRILTASERRQLSEKRKSSWHKWFAWHPIRLSHDIHEVRWLGFIYRKGTSHYTDEGEYWSWEYAETSLDVLRQRNNER